VQLQSASLNSCKGHFGRGQAAAPGHLQGRAPAGQRPPPALLPQLWPSPCITLSCLPEESATPLQSLAALPVHGASEMSLAKPPFAGLFALPVCQLYCTSQDCCCNCHSTCALGSTVSPHRWTLADALAAVQDIMLTTACRLQQLQGLHSLQACPVWAGSN